MSDYLKTRIEDLPLSTWAKNALYNNDVATVEELLGLSEDCLLRMHHFGKGCLEGVKAELGKHGLHLAKHKPLVRP